MIWRCEDCNCIGFVFDIPIEEILRIHRLECTYVGPQRLRAKSFKPFLTAADLVMLREMKIRL